MANTGLMPAVGLTAPLYGIESHAAVVRHGEDDQTWAAGFMQENALCGISGATWVWCGTTAESELTGNEGDSDGRWEQVYPFLVAAEDSCRTALNARRPEAQDHLLEILDFMSLKGAERELLVGASNTESKALLRNANDVGTGLSPRAALAIVENEMAVCLPGVASTIHMAPGTASLLDGSLEERDGKLWTIGGNQVIAGTGYAQPVGEVFQIYGTGPVTLHLGPSQMVTTDLAQMADIKNNEFALRAERLVAVTFDGCCHVMASGTYS